MGTSNLQGTPKIGGNQCCPYTGYDESHLVGVEDDEVAERPGVRVLDEDLLLAGAGGLQQHGHPALPLQHQPAPATSLVLEMNIKN